MKVLDLQCTQHHVFEGWFDSEDDYQSQLTRGLLTCPLCGDAKVAKKLSAPRLNLNTARGERDTTNAQDVSPSANINASSNDLVVAPEAAEVNTAQALAPNMQNVTNLELVQLQETLLKMVRHVVANTEDVGDHFAEEARKMHYGETESRNIRGRATQQETSELMDEGITVMPLPFSDILKEPLQ